MPAIERIIQMYKALNEYFASVECFKILNDFFENPLGEIWF